MEVSHKRNERFQINEYCAIYVDVMGQKKFLSELAQSDSAEAQRRVCEFSEPIWRFKEGVYKRACEVKDDVREIIKSKQRDESCYEVELLKMVDDVSFGIQQFSDSTLLYVRMGTPVSFMVLLMFVEFIIFRMMDNMGSGVVLRGGIAIGKGWEVGANCLMGQVVSDAYNLESQISQWGRITVSALFLSRLKGVCDLAHKLNGHGIVELFKPLFSLIQKDVDGMFFLDYLNPVAEVLYKRENFSSEWFMERIEKGYSFINKQLHAFCLRAEQCPELAQLALRYDIMRGYWYSRLGLWSSLPTESNK